MASGPLDGIRILEFSQIVALPFGGCIMSDLGAEVIKVEALTGDPHRNLGAVIPKEGKRFHSLNRGKRSLAVDLQQPAGREADLPPHAADRRGHDQLPSRRRQATGHRLRSAPRRTVPD